MADKNQLQNDLTNENIKLHGDVDQMINQQNALQVRIDEYRENQEKLERVKSQLEEDYASAQNQVSEIYKNAENQNAQMENQSLEFGKKLTALQEELAASENKYEQLALQKESQMASIMQKLEILETELQTANNEKMAINVELEKSLIQKEEVTQQFQDMTLCFETLTKEKEAEDEEKTVNLNLAAERLEKIKEMESQISELTNTATKNFELVEKLTNEKSSLELDFAEISKNS